MTRNDDDKDLHASNVAVGEVEEADDVLADSVPRPEEAKLSDTTGRVPDVVKSRRATRVRGLGKNGAFRQFFVVNEERVGDPRRRLILVVVDVVAVGVGVAANGDHSERDPD